MRLDLASERAQGERSRKSTDVSISVFDLLEEERAFKFLEESFTT